MNKPILKENFRWMAAPEFQIVDTGKNTITIKGVAVKKGQVSRNKRKYAGEELAKGARTFIGRPVTINHAPYEKNHPMYDGRKVPGHVEWMEYEDGRMEYRAKINKQPYVDLIRNKSVEIRGVSIEADYLFNRCGQCGKDFYTVEDFDSHMVNEHFIKNYNYEPRGIVGKALSLVLSPEEPGVPDTSIELMETTQRFAGFSQLLETVTIYEKERERQMVKKQPKPKTEIPYKTKRIAEQEEDHGCKEDEHWDGEKCVKNEAAEEQEDHGCAEDEHWDGEKCVKNEAVAEQEIPLAAPIAADVTTEVPAVVTPEEMPLEEPEALPPPPLECGDGFHEEDGGCVPDEEVTAQEPEPEQPPPATETVALQFEQPKITLPKILKLGEPFASYTNFDDCVSKNSDKDDPEAYCADIKRKTEGETAKEVAPSKDVYERLDLLYNMSKQQYQNSVKRDVKLAESINSLNRAIAQFYPSLPKLVPTINKTLKTLQTQVTESISKVHGEVGKTNTELKTVKEYNAKKFGQLATAQAKGDSLAKQQNQRISEAYKHLKADKTMIQQLAKRDMEIAETVKKATEGFEKILSVADKNVDDLTEKNKTLEQRVAEMEKEKEDKDKKTVTETTKILTHLENLEAKLTKGNFKGSSKPLGPSETSGKDQLGEETPYNT